MNSSPTSATQGTTLRASWRHWLDGGAPAAGPWWLQHVWTVAFAATVAVLFTVVLFASNARTLDDWLAPGAWALWYGRNLVISLVIGFAIRGLFALARRTLGLEFMRGLTGWRRTAFFSGIPLLGVAIGWPLAMVLVFGNLRMFARMRPVEVLSTIVFSLLVSTAFYVWFSLRHKEIRAEMRANEAQLRLLQGQMEPHFLFNTLANVISLIDADAPRAKHMLESLTDYLRASLVGLRHDDSTLAAELELARHYLELMRTRMGDRLRFEIVADDALGRAALMPLVLQPLIENAVKHGLEPQVDGGTVRVTAARLPIDGEDCLRVCIEDDGAGVAAAARRPRRSVAGRPDGHGIALANLRERLQARFGPHARLTLEDIDGGPHATTLACLVVPWRDAAAG